MINYRHLYYFYTVAQNESISKASKVLHLTPQTISGQLSQFEQRLDIELFKKSGRGLKLTDSGKVVLEFAERIFSLGGELEHRLMIMPEKTLSECRIGILDVIPKTIAYQLLSPVYKMTDPIKLVCKEGKIDDLLVQLAQNKLDLVLSDRKIPDDLKLKCFNHPLGKSGISFFASQTLGDLPNKPFPKNLRHAPFLIQSKQNRIHEKILSWLKEHELEVHIKGEFDDSALLKAFGREGHGVFAGLSSISKQIEKEYQVKEIGRTYDITEEFYAISIERKIAHPAVKAITNLAEKLFS